MQQQAIDVGTLPLSQPWKSSTDLDSVQLPKQWINIASKRSALIKVSGHAVVAIVS